MNDRPEFLDQLKEDLETGVPRFRRRQRRGNIAAVVGVLAWIGIAVGFAVWAIDSTPETVLVEVVGSEVPETAAAADGVPTGGLLTDTVKDLDDRANQPPEGSIRTDDGAYGSLEFIGETRWGAFQACPTDENLHTGPRISAIEGVAIDEDELGELLAFVQQHVWSTYSADAPISASKLYVAPPSELVGESTRYVAAPWSPGEDALIGALFQVWKAGGEWNVLLNLGCTSFLFDQASDEALEVAGNTPWGAPTECPGSKVIFNYELFGTPESMDDYFGEALSFVQNFIDSSYPSDAPIAQSEIFIVPTRGPPGQTSRYVAAPWPDDGQRIGMWFSVAKTEAGFGFGSTWACETFLTGSDASDAGFPATGEIGGYSQIGCGIIDYEPWANAQQLADASDLVVVGSVGTVRQGRSFQFPDSPQNVYQPVTLELVDTTDLSGKPVPGPVYVEVEVCGPVENADSGILIGALRAEEVSTMIPPDSPAVWFLSDVGDWTPWKDVEAVNPLAGRASDDLPLYVLQAGGLWYEGQTGRVAVANGESPATFLPGWAVFADLPADDLLKTLNKAID